MAGDIHRSGFGLYPYVSQSALSAILKDIRDNGLPSAQSRRSIKRARERDTRVATAHGPLIREMSVISDPGPPPTSFDIEYIDPAALLSHTLTTCPGFGDYLQSKMREHPPSPQAPWGIIIYSDEVNPGNQLKHDNKRKTQAIYWAFVEWGPQGLCREALWFVLTVVRSSVVKDMGGMGVLLRYLLEAAFVNNTNFKHGVSLHRGEQAFLLFASFRIFVSDESALRSTWDVKGASGLLPCMFCRNAVLHRSGLHNDDPSGYLVSMVNPYFSKLVLHTDASFKEAFQTLALQHGTIAPGDFIKLEQCLGMRYNSMGLMASQTLSAELNPISGTMFDWMHVYCVNGIVNLECGLLLHCLSQSGVSHRHIHAYTQRLVWPFYAGGKGCTGKDVFKKRGSAAANESLKCSASEILAIYSPLRSFLMSHVQPGDDNVLAKAIQSYFCLARVLDMLTALSKGGITATQLKDAIELHLVSFLQVYDPEWIIPKHHFALHLHRSYQNHSVLVSCWVHERKHKEVKRYANNLSNTSSHFESNILESVLQVQLNTLSDPWEFPSADVVLASPRPASEEVRGVVQAASGLQGDVEVSNEVVCQDGHRCSIKDVVVFMLEGATYIGEVWIHARIADRSLSCVSRWDPLGHNRFRATDNPIMISTSCVHRACIYERSNDVATVVPYSFM